jgi:lysyl-tRNA synthetase class II
MIKAPVTIDILMEEWSKDSIIDETEPGRELIKISKTHSKYLNIMSHHNLIVKKLTIDYNKLKKIKWEYYSGDLNNPEDLEQYGLEPWVKKTLRQDIPMYIDSDKELNNILLKRVIHQEIVDYCQSIIKELNSRTWQLKSFIDWEKFTSGG